jgi:hypothetical protein
LAGTHDEDGRCQQGRHDLQTEYVDMAGKLWDMKHANMMKSDTGMKDGMMTKAQFIQFSKGLFLNPGLVGGN